MTNALEGVLARPRDLTLPARGDLAIVRTLDRPPLYYLSRVARTSGGRVTELEELSTGRSIPCTEWPRLDQVTWAAAQEVHVAAVVAMAPTLVASGLAEFTRVLADHRRRTRPELVPDWVLRLAGYRPEWQVTLSAGVLETVAAWTDGGPGNRWVQGERLVSVATVVRQVVEGAHPRERVAPDLFRFGYDGRDLVVSVGRGLHPSAAVGVAS
ncbi:hypothetical protein BJF83_24775 [Nocardiopsis sp. CNR-923]|uniref:hypothetical protein n=1 Tax=Nocardiopsis sp. CNR-923 TaxID=1904965 RepID=UPI00096327FF|nr:hypothetical protein [Nocardiopsis sp. CNR-923]OLT30470.1 hypothetical protein BJF83_24775 [Nocardiopsis sp. CNR-923]